MKYQLGVNSVVRKKTTPKINLGDIPRNRESSLYSGDEKNYLGTGENYKTLGGSFDTKKGSFGAETWINKANMSPSLYGTYSKEIKPNLNLDASVGINDRYIGLGLTKSFSKGGVNLVAGGEKHRVYVKKSPTGVGKGVKGHVMVNHPTSDKGKWDTIDLTEKAGAKTVEQGKAATRKWHRENPYKMQDGSKKIKTLKKKHLGDIYEKEKDNEGNDLQGFDYWKEKFMKDNNLSEEDAIALIDEIKSEQRLRGVSDKIYKYKNPFVESSEIIPETYTLPYNKYVDMKTLKANKPNRNMVIGEDVFLSGAKSVKQYRGDENLPEAKKGMKNCGCKHPKSKYKYGTGALTIPEGSAIVTAQVDKKTGTIPAKKAIELYKYAKQTNSTKAWKGLNNLIEKMPEDRVSKKQAGTNNLDALKQKYSWFNPFTAANTPTGGISRTTGQITTLDPTNYESTYNRLEEVIREAEGKGTKIDNMESLQGYIYDTMPEDRKKELWSTYGPTAKESGLSQEEFMKLSDAEKRKIFVDKIAGARTMFGLNRPAPQVSSDSNIKPQSIKENLDKNKFLKDKDSIRRRGLNVPAMAEIAARSSILGQGIEGVPENYLKLGRYKYASQLPKTLREIQLAEQAGKETARDIVAGDAGRYLAQTGSLSSARMKAANDAVIQDTLARQQEEINRNIAQGDREAEYNTGLRNQYAQQRAMARAAYDQQLVGLGQKIDSATETAQEMANQRRNDDQRLAMLKSIADSGNYDIVTNPDGTISYSVKQSKKGLKKVKTYKRK